MKNKKPNTNTRQFEAPCGCRSLLRISGEFQWTDEAMCKKHVEEMFGRWRSWRRWRPHVVTGMYDQLKLDLK